MASLLSLNIAVRKNSCNIYFERVISRNIHYKESIMKMAENEIKLICFFSILKILNFAKKSNFDKFTQFCSLHNQTQKRLVCLK